MTEAQQFYTPKECATQNQERFRTRTAPHESGCLVWTGCLSASGYGRFYMGGETLWAHRVAYEFKNGSIPAGLVIDHLCRNRACVNPNHMEVVSNAENLRRGLAFNYKDGCNEGHTREPVNAQGRRICRKCKNAAGRRDGRRYRELNAEKERERGRKYYAANREKKIESVRKHRERKKSERCG